MKHDARQYLPPILTALIVAILPHLGRLPLWVIAWCAFMWGYVLISLRNNWPWPNRWVRNGLTVLGIVGLLATYTTRIGPEAYLGLLAVMAAVKPFEVQTHRDRMITVFLAYFIVITSLLQAETLTITIYMFISVLVTTATLIRINDPEGRYSKKFRLAGVIMAQSIPLMLILFFLFPRIQGSLFGLSPLSTGSTGFSDSLRPGAISRLVENNAVAFRAEFEQAMPPAHLLYWRGIVFKHFDGRSWQRDNRVPQLSTPIAGDRRFAYTISLEPHNNRWLFALDLPGKIPPWTTMHADYTLFFRRPVNKSRRYEMVSFTGYNTGGLKQPAAEWIELPKSGNPQARQLAARLVRQTSDTDAAVDRVLEYFRTNGFAYTLKPPVLGADPIDDFLFRSKKGFCEHFASTFAFMMRSVGTPARIVGGYLGGEINPYGGYLVVRQSDAHVWVEVWDEATGWLRVDPTLAVAPERVTGGMEGALFPDEQSGGLARPVWTLFQQVRFGWDALNTKWQSWFSGYSYAEQKSLLARIGIRLDTWRGPFQAFLIILGSAFLMIGGYMVLQFKPRREKSDPVKTGYELFCRKLARAQLPKSPDQGPNDYASEIIEKREDLRESVTEITDLYIRLRFARHTDRRILDEFRDHVRRFSPKKP